MADKFSMFPSPFGVNLAYVIIILVAVIAVYLLFQTQIDSFFSWLSLLRKKPTPATKKEAEPPKKPAVAKKPWPKKVKVGITVLVLLLGAVLAFMVFDIQLSDFQLPDIQFPDIRISNAAFKLAFAIVLVGCIVWLMSNRKKAVKVALVMLLMMVLVFWLFGIPVLLLADQDGEEYGYNPMDFAPAVELSGLEIKPRSITVNASAPSASVFFSLTVKHVEITPNSIRVKVVWQRKHRQMENASVNLMTYLLDNWGNRLPVVEVEGLSLNGKCELGRNKPFSATLIFALRDNRREITTLDLYLLDLWGHCFLVKGIKL